MQVTAIGRPQHRTTPGGQNTVTTQGQLIDHRFFHVSESRLTFALEKLPYRAAHPVLEDMVSVNETQIHTPGQLAADGGLSGAWQAHASDS
jgi:hypothetical protein